MKLQDVVSSLNGLLAIDGDAISRLCSHTVQANKKLVTLPGVVANCNGPVRSVSVAGLLEGAGIFVEWKDDAIVGFHLKEVDQESEPTDPAQGQSSADPSV